MGFYVTETGYIRQEKTRLPSKNRVVGSEAFSFDCTGSTWSETQCSRRENEPTPTTTVSGVRYYGYRFYSPTLGRWISRDPIGERGGISLCSFLLNNPINSIDYVGWEQVIVKEFDFETRCMNLPDWLVWVIGGIPFTHPPADTWPISGVGHSIEYDDIECPEEAPNDYPDPEWANRDVQWGEWQVCYEYRFNIVVYNYTSKKPCCEE